MVRAKFSDNIGNTFAGVMFHNWIAVPISETMLITYPGVGVVYEANDIGQCLTIITPSEMRWLMMYWYDNNRYLATSEEPMCDHIAEIVGAIEAGKDTVIGRDLPAKLTDWYNRYPEFYSPKEAIANVH